MRILTTALTLMSLLTAGHASAAVNVFPMTADGGFADIVERTLPSVARVITVSSGPKGKGTGEGSAVIFSADGLLLTNHHVIEGATKIMVQLHDDRELAATVVAADPPTDLAILKVEATGLPALPLGDSGKVRIGDYALAIGNPFGSGTAVSLGIISAKGDGGYIQTDASINPGNSGGPLLNTHGEVIGINTAILSTSGGSNGVGFALPSDLAKFVAGELLTKGHVDRGYLGAAFQPISDTLQEALGVKRGGAVVTDVAPEGPAAKAGLKKGDVVVAINGRILRDFQRLQLYAARAKPGASIEITVARGGEEAVVPVTLGERPATAAMAAEEVLPGAAVSEAAGQGPVVMGVDPRGASAEAGLRPGDVIVGVNRKAVPGLAALREQLTGTTGNAVLLEISREGSTYFLALPKM